MPLLIAEAQSEVINDVRAAPNKMLIVEKAIAGITEGSGELDKSGFFKEQRAKGFYLTKQSYAGGHVIVAYHKMPWTGKQKSHSGPFTGLIQGSSSWVQKAKRANRGMEMIMARHVPGRKYAVVMAMGTGLSDTQIISNNAGENFFLEVSRSWSRRKQIIDFSYGNNEFMALVGKHSEITTQTFMMEDWPAVDREIKKSKRRGLYVTSLFPIDSMYFLVLSQVRTISDQVVVKCSDDDYKQKIQNKENEGFRVTGLVNVFEQNPDEPYVVVMSKVNGKSKLFP